MLKTYTKLFFKGKNEFSRRDAKNTNGYGGVVIDWSSMH